MISDKFTMKTFGITPSFSCGFVSNIKKQCKRCAKKKQFGGYQKFLANRVAGDSKVCMCKKYELFAPSLTVLNLNQKQRSYGSLKLVNLELCLSLFFDKTVKGICIQGYQCICCQ
jgi:hypothetical protein